MDAQEKKAVEKEQSPVGRDAPASQRFGQFLQERFHNLAKGFSGQQLWPTMTILAQLVFIRGMTIKSGLKRESAANNTQKDMSRIIGGGLIAVTDVWLLTSTREAKPLEGETMWERVKYALRNPKECAVQLRYLMCAFPAAIYLLGDVWYGLKGTEKEKGFKPGGRLLSASMAASIQIMALAGMFNASSTKEKGLNPRSNVVTESAKYSPLKALLHGIKKHWLYVASDTVELAIGLNTLKEGVKKTTSGEGRNIREGKQVIALGVAGIAIVISNSIYNLWKMGSQDKRKSEKRAEDDMPLAAPESQLVAQREEPMPAGEAIGKYTGDVLSRRSQQPQREAEPLRDRLQKELERAVAPSPLIACSAR